MTELRRDPIAGHTVLLQPERAHRPIPDLLASPACDPTDCPFCVGQESQTPGAVSAVRAADGGWHVRVVPNLFPILTMNSPVAGSQANTHTRGIHEVIIECPFHESRISQFDHRQMVRVVDTYRGRFQTHAANESLQYALLFKNEGRQAGASVEHCHSQLVATEFIPALIQDRLETARQHFQEQQECAYCRVVESEREALERMVFDGNSFFAYCPYAARFPFEVCILPKSHSDTFFAETDNDWDELAALLRTILLRLESEMPGMAFNYAIHTAPFHQQHLPHFHWHLEILPRSTLLAGFELACGLFVNTVAPEDAATRLRIHQLDKD